MSGKVCSEGKGKESIKRCHDRRVVLVCCCPSCYFCRNFQKWRGEARLINGCADGVEAGEVQDSTCGDASTERSVQTKRERETKTTTPVHSSRKHQKQRCVKWLTEAINQSIRKDLRPPSRRRCAEMKRETETLRANMWNKNLYDAYVNRNEVNPKYTKQAKNIRSMLHVRYTHRENTGQALTVTRAPAVYMIGPRRKGKERMHRASLSTEACATAHREGHGTAHQSQK